MPFAWRHGVQVLGTNLWCDAHRAPGVVFLSRGDIDANGSGLVGTAMTAGLRTTLGLGGDVLCATYGRVFSIGATRVELFPSGLMPGAASILFELNGERLVYAGAVGRVGHEVRTCSTLCLYAPEPAEGGSAWRIDRKVPTVFLAPGLGEGLALARDLEGAGVRLRAPQRVRAALGLLGVSVLPFRGTPGPGEALLWPLGARRASAVTRIPRAKQVILPEAAVSGSSLVDYTISTGAREVLVLGPGAAALCQQLRKRGIPAQVMNPHFEQLPLFDGTQLPQAVG